LGFVFRAKDETTHVVQKVNAGLDDLKKSASQANSSMTAAFGMSTRAIAGMSVALGAVAAGAAFELASVSGRFEKGLTSAGAIAGATIKEFQMLRKAALDAGLAAQFSPTEATKALQDLAAAGFNVKESIGLLTPVLDLAGGSLGQLGPSEAASLASQSMKAFGISISGAGLAVDQMLKSVNMFALEAKDLPLSLGIASRGAQVMNQSLSETLIAVGLVKNIIPSIERSATGVAVAMERLVDPEWAEKVGKLGVAVTTSDGKFRSFLDILNELQPQLAKMSEKDTLLSC
jgi:TP901 family phage tail tape measure protein